jgi:hypothetical protein
MVYGWVCRNAQCTSAQYNNNRQGITKAPQGCDNDVRAELVDVSGLENQKIFSFSLKICQEDVR